MKPGTRHTATANTTQASTVASETPVSVVDVPLVDICTGLFAGCLISAIFAIPSENRRLVFGLSGAALAAVTGAYLLQGSTLHLRGTAAFVIDVLLHDRDVRPFAAIPAIATALTYMHMETRRLRKLAGLPEKDTWGTAPSPTERTDG